MRSGYKKKKEGCYAVFDTRKDAELEETARQLRVDSLRLIHRRGAGHPAGRSQAAEIMAVLYFHLLPHRPGPARLELRDRFILSKDMPRRCFTRPWPGAVFLPSPNWIIGRAGLPAPGSP